MKQTNFLAVKIPNTILGIGEALLNEEGDFWALISNEDINITYSEAKAMDKVERACAFAAIKSIKKRREKQKK